MIPAQGSGWKLGSGPGAFHHGYYGRPADGSTDAGHAENEYIYLYLNNETAQNAFFDNLVIRQNRGAILQEDHYYPFGLTMAGIPDQAPLRPENNYKFQGQELQYKEFSDGSGLETYQFKYRMDNPQTGRFWQIDPLAEKYIYNSPYAFLKTRYRVRRP